MFTGIVEEVGTVTSLQEGDGHARLSIACRTVVDDVRIGDSIAVDGCCLTVTDRTGEGFVAELMTETLRATALGHLRSGSRVNLERAMAVGDRLGGHLVQGHVDGVGEVVDRHDEPGMVLVTVSVPHDLARYVVAKGSITLAGVSLTIIDVDERPALRVGLIPHTLAHTTIGELTVGDRVNLEVDVLARYVERLVAPAAARDPEPRR